MGRKTRSEAWEVPFCFLEIKCKLFFFFWFIIIFLNFILFLKFTILYQFCQISKWIHHRYTCVSHPEPCSLLPPHTLLWVVPVHQPQASSIVHRTWTGDWFHTWYYTCFNAILFSRFPSHWPFHTGGGYAYLMEVTITHDYLSTQCYSLLSRPELTSGHTYSSLTSHMLQLPVPTSVCSLIAHYWKLQWKISCIV